MGEAVDLWQAEHTNFLRLIEVVEKEMNTFHNGDHPDYDLMRNAVQYLRHFPDRYHHPREEVAFARLIGHRPMLQSEVNLLIREHQFIAAAGDELLAHLEEAALDAMVSRKTLEDAASTYLRAYRHHIHSEDRDILPLAEKLLTPDDWRAVAYAIPGARDPLFGQDASEQYRELRRLIAIQS